MVKAHNFKDLEVWQLGREFAVKVYQITARFPESEKFGLTLQARRSAISVPMNIAEGHGLRSDAGFSRHLKIALGSLNETETALTIAADLQYLESQQLEALQRECTRLAVKISNLLQSLAKVVREGIDDYVGNDDLASGFPQSSSVTVEPRPTYPLPSST